MGTAAAPATGDFMAVKHVALSATPTEVIARVTTWQTPGTMLKGTGECRPIIEIVWPSAHAAATTRPIPPSLVADEKYTVRAALVVSDSTTVEITARRADLGPDFSTRSPWHVVVIDPGCAIGMAIHANYVPIAGDVTPPRQ